ncbi:MAG TPA: hypothetical protein VJN18_31215 [Polyangiaceae bacterium]|nr:hypothetical protein [Polyangiaceae bacterium]
MRTKIALVSFLAGLGALLPAAAWGQDAPAAAAPAAPPAPAAPAEAAAAPAPAPAPEAAPAAPVEATAAEVAAAADGPAPWPGWIRIDSDASLLQMWGGGTAPLTDGVGLAFDMYVNSLNLGELDVGPAITAGPLTLTPMIGLQIDWVQRRAVALVPQFYAVGSLGPIYTELWFQYYMNTVFQDDPPAPAGPIANDIFVRLIADFKISDYVAAGLELDLNHNSENTNLEGEDDGIKSLAIGPNVMLSNVGAGSSFMVFLGYETKPYFGSVPGGGPPPNGEKDSANHLTGRLTFVHNF